MEQADFRIALEEQDTAVHQCGTAVSESGADGAASWCRIGNRGQILSSRAAWLLNVSPAIRECGESPGLTTKRCENTALKKNGGSL